MLLRLVKGILKGKSFKLLVSSSSYIYIFEIKFCFSQKKYVSLISFNSVAVYESGCLIVIFPCIVTREAIYTLQY